MDKTLIIIRISILIVLLMCCNHVVSQEMHSKELIWVYESSCKQVFNDTEKALKWSQHQVPFVLSEKRNEKQWRNTWIENEEHMIITHSKMIQLKNDNFYLVISEGCSGIPCQNIFVFKEEESYWCLIAHSQARSMEMIEIESNNETIILKAKSGQIGKLKVER